MTVFGDSFLGKSSNDKIQLWNIILSYLESLRKIINDNVDILFILEIKSMIPFQLGNFLMMTLTLFVDYTPISLVKIYYSTSVRAYF